MKNILSQIRNKKGFSQAKLAKVIGTSQQTLSSWEIGRTLPKPSQMQHLQDVLGVEKEDIFFEAFDYKMEYKE